MPEVIALAAILTAAVISLALLVVWDFLRQRTRLSAASHEDKVRSLEARVTELEMENLRLRQELSWLIQASKTAELKPADPFLSGPGRNE